MFSSSSVLPRAVPSFLFTAEPHRTASGRRFVHPLVGRWTLGCVHGLASANKDAMTVRVHKACVL